MKVMLRSVLLKQVTKVGVQAKGPCMQAPLEGQKEEDAGSAYSLQTWNIGGKEVSDPGLWKSTLRGFWVSAGQDIPAAAKVLRGRSSGGPFLETPMWLFKLNSLTATQSWKPSWGQAAGNSCGLSASGSPKRVLATGGI